MVSLGSDLEINGIDVGDLDNRIDQIDSSLAQCMFLFDALPEGDHKLDCWLSIVTETEILNKKLLIAFRDWDSLPNNQVYTVRIISRITSIGNASGYSP